MPSPSISLERRRIDLDNGGVQMSCPQMDTDGLCHGKYHGFACIKDKCRADVQHICVHSTEGGHYCTKFHRFECIGVENCGTLEDYLSFVRARRDRSQA
jgi:hypothetical protein